MAGGCPVILLPDDSSVPILIMAFKLVTVLELFDTVFMIVSPSDGCFWSPSLLEVPFFFGGRTGGGWGWK